MPATVKASRAEPIPMSVEQVPGADIVLPPASRRDEKGRLIALVPPLTLGGYRAVLALDPVGEDADNETPWAFAVRVGEQLLAALPERWHTWAKTLTLAQARILIAALVAEYIGQDPALMVAFQLEMARLTREQRDARQQELMDAVDELSVGLASRLKRTPAEIDDIPLTDALSLQEALEKRHAEYLKFEARIHGVRQA